MAFIGRFSLLGAKPPTKLYLHKTGYAEAFGNADAGIEYITLVLARHKDLFKKTDYTLTQLFGFNKKKMAQVFGYGDFEWAYGNPTQCAWVFENGIYMPEEPEKGCGEFDVVRGREEELRWSAKNLSDFMHRWPDLPDRILDANLDF